jgi:hypothetical protein
VSVTTPYQLPGVREDIEGLALVACRCITGRFAKLTVRAVSVELCPSGEGHAFIVLFHNIAAFDVSDESAHVLLIILVCCFSTVLWILG